MDTIPEPELPTEPATDWLEDHLDLLPELPTLLAGTAVQHGPSVVIKAAIAYAALYGTRAAVRRWRNLRHPQNTRLIEAAVPPQVEEASAAAWWKHLAGHLAPRWKCLVYGQPHVAFEYVADENGVRFQVWVPGTISPGVVEKAVQAAWPGRTITTRPALPPVPLDATAAGGRLVLGNAEHLPLKHDHEADPLRPLLEAMAGLRKGEHAAVQILARPCTGRRLRHAYRAASQLRGGRSKGLQATIFDSITPGKSGDHGRPTPSEIAQSYPERAKQVQAILAKAGQSRFEVQIRYQQSPPAGR